MSEHQRTIALLLAAAACFAVATLDALGRLSTNYDAWVAGGLVALALALISQRAA